MDLCKIGSLGQASLENERIGDQAWYRLLLNEKSIYLCCERFYFIRVTPE